jgi:glucose/arabinose dehydrogenase
MSIEANAVKIKHKLWISTLFTSAAVLFITACGPVEKLPISSGMGAKPNLPMPTKKLIPTVNIAPAIGWGGNQTPKAAYGLKVAAFAKNLNHPRWLYTLPNGDVLVAETNASPTPEGRKGIWGWVMGLVMDRAGAGVKSPNRIILLRDADYNGQAEIHVVFLEGLYSPFGMALVNGYLYVANTNAIVRFPYMNGDTVISATGEKVTELPEGLINHHWTKNIIANADGTKLYVTVGSNSNVAERGMEVETERAAIWEVDIQTGMHRLFATGLRNPNGLAWEGQTGELFTVVNERDELGDNLVPDYLTGVKEGGFYGWPYSYYGQYVDARVQPQQPERVATAIAPDYALGSHTASLGLVSSIGTSLPSQFSSGMFIGQHGSWNRKPLSGYKVIYVPFVDGKPTGKSHDILTGFISKDGEAFGRPVGVALDKTGALLVADDVGNTVWRVTSGE